jgi:hypothetical protein
MKFFIIFILGITTSYANIGKVIFLKGSASMLPPHTVDPVVITKGMVVKEDASILTKDKSVVRIKFNKGGNLTVAPKSKVVVRQTKNKKTELVGL